MNHTMTARSTFAGAVALALAMTGSSALAGTDEAAKTAPAAGTIQAHGDATQLVHGVEQTVTGKEKYAYDTSVIYYSAVAVRSEGGKPTLSLFADEANDTLLAKSSQQRKKTEFVVVDSNHAPVPSTYYPTVTSKGGESTVELDSDAQILSDGVPIAGTFSASDVVLVMDPLLQPGVEYTFSVASESDVEIYLLQSGGTAETSYLSRADAVASADKRGAGKTEKITYTNTGADADWFGFVVINKSGSGAYTVTKAVA